MESVTIKDKEIRFGNRQFLELEDKISYENGEETLYVNIVHGEFDKKNVRRFKKSIAIPKANGIFKEFVKTLVDYLGE